MVPAFFGISQFEFFNDLWSEPAFFKIGEANCLAFFILFKNIGEILLCKIIDDLKTFLLAFLSLFLSYLLGRGLLFGPGYAVFFRKMPERGDIIEMFMFHDEVHGIA